MKLVSALKLQEYEPLFETTSAIPTSTSVYLSTKKIVTILFIITGLLLVASLFASYFMVYYPADDKFAKKYIEFFYLNNENNLPSLFSTMLLFIAALLNFAIYNVASDSADNRKDRYYWFTIGCLFVFLGLDESLQIHEMLNHRSAVEHLAGKNEFVSNTPWVVPYAIGILVIGSFFVKFVFSLPANTRNRFIIAGIIYIGGAMGFECLESFIHFHGGNNSIFYKSSITVEEVMEMVGAILFIHALLDYIKLHNVSFKISKSS